jgi:hypothetical protein
VKIGLSIWPADNAEWLELSLSTIPNVEVALIAALVELPAAPLDLIILDAESPGPGFLSLYKKIKESGAVPPLVVLGTPNCPVMMAIDWDEQSTLFIAKPFRIEDVRTMVAKRLTELAATPEPAKTETSPAAPEHVPAPKHPLGYLSTLRLSDLIQMLCLNNWTGRIEITNLGTGETGRVHLNVGILIHADCGQRQAEEACYQMLSWGRCQFNFIEEHEPVIQNVQTPWQHVVLEGARLLDENIAATG